MATDSTARNDLDGPETGEARSNTLESIGQRLQEQREQSQRFLSAQRERLDKIEDRLLRDLTGLGKRLEQWVSYESALEERHGELQQDSEAIAAKSSRLEQQHEELAQKRERLATQLRERRAALQTKQTGLADAKEEEIDQLHRELTTEREAVAQARAQYEQAVRDAESRESVQQKIENELHAARESLVESRKEEEDSRQKLAQTRKVLSDRAEQLNQLRDQIEQLTRQQESDAGNEEHVEELLQLRKERDELMDQVSELKSREEQWQAAEVDPGELSELQRRFELAVGKVRDLKLRNMDLESRLNELQDATDSAGGDDNSNWEAQKQRLLNRLEQQNGTGTPAASDAADAAVDPATETAAHAGHDELEHERAELRKLQDEWREKLRSAEVEISIERADNARARMELQERVRELEQQVASASEPRVEGQNRPRRRWLERLGLADDDG